MKRNSNGSSAILTRRLTPLENELKWINIAGMPFLVTLSGISLALFKRKRTAAK